MLDKSKTKFLMIASAALMAFVGFSASFFPEELLKYFDTSANGIAVIMVEVVGALYVGFALLNWMARANVIGAIYSRPVAIGNFAHFFIASIVLTKYVVSTTYSSIILGLGIANALFAVAFGYLLFAGGKACQ